MGFEHVSGIKKKTITLFALSTCAWCKKTKQLLDSLGVEYDYVFIDSLGEGEKEEFLNELKKWNPRRSFPTLVIGEEECIVGFKEDLIREAVGE
ncbi:MAG: glutaredoxin family protein [Thermoplasmatota archaeon]